MKTKNNDYLFLPIERNRKRKFPLDEILYLEADNTYTTIKLQCGTNYVISKPIKDFESLLNTSNFFKISRSSIVNLHYVVEIFTGSKPNLMLKNNELIIPDKNKIKLIEERILFSQSELATFSQ